MELSKNFPNVRPNEFPNKFLKDCQKELRNQFPFQYSTKFLKIKEIVEKYIFELFLKKIDTQISENLLKKIFKEIVKFLRNYRGNSQRYR